MTEPDSTQCGNCEGIDPSTCFVCGVAQPAGQPLDLDHIERRAGDHADHQKLMGWSCCTSHHSANDVPDLIAEIRRLRARLADVNALCDQAEQQATRWQDPLPVPGWVDDIRAAING